MRVAEMKVDRENGVAVVFRRCLVECYGHDINRTQRDLHYTAISDLRNEYHPGEELDCIVTSFDPNTDDLRISVKTTQFNPFDGAEQRHPVSSRRYATIAANTAAPSVRAATPTNTRIPTFLC